MAWASVDVIPAQVTLNAQYAINFGAYTNELVGVIPALKKSDGTAFDASALSGLTLTLGQPSGMVPTDFTNSVTCTSVAGTSGGKVSWINTAANLGSAIPPTTSNVPLSRSYSLIGTDGTTSLLLAKGTFNVQANV